MTDKNGKPVRAGDRVLARVSLGNEPERWVSALVVWTGQHSYINPRTGWESHHWTATVEYDDPPQKRGVYPWQIKVEP